MRNYSLHFNDVPAELARAKQSDADRAYPGAGILDLGRMISILKDAGCPSRIEKVIRR